MKNPIVKIAKSIIEHSPDPVQTVAPGTRIISADPSSTPKTKRMSVNLSGDAASMLSNLAESQGITQNEALRKAIATESYLRHEIEQGTKVLLQKSNKEIREVVFR